MKPFFYPLEYILNTVATHFGINPKEICGPDRHQHVALARHIVMYFARQHSGMALASIGHRLGRRDHSTVVYGITTIEGRRGNDEVISRHVTDIGAALSAGRLAPDDVKLIEFNRMVVAVHGATNEAWKLLAAGESMREVAKIIEVGLIADLAQRVAELCNHKSKPVAA